MKLLHDNDSEMIWVSDKINNGDWDFYFMLRLQYMDGAISEEEIKDFGKYCVEIHAVSPEAAGKEKVMKAFDSAGIGYLEDPILQSELLLQEGISAPLFSKAGHNKKALLKEAREQLRPMSILFGFYMDRPVNRVGDTGWDWIAGNLMARLSMA